MRDIISQTKCANGITAYFRRTDLTMDLVYLVLSVRVGSLDDGEKYGISHFLEHCNMSFEKYREPIPSLHYRARAYTDYYSTNYIFTCKKDEMQIVFALLQNLLLGNYLIPESFLEIKQDVLEEWQKKQLDEEYQSLVTFFDNTKYAAKLPVGEPEALRILSFLEVETFFYQWYTPDRMAIMVIGDLPQNIEEQVEKLEFAEREEKKKERKEEIKRLNIRFANKTNQIKKEYNLENNTGEKNRVFFYLPLSWKSECNQEENNRENFIKTNFLYDICSDVIAKALDGQKKYYLDKKGCQRSFFAPLEEILYLSIINEENRETEILRREISDLILNWLNMNFEILKEEYRTAFSCAENYISVKIMGQQCIEHYIYKRPLTDYGYENKILVKYLEKIEKDTIKFLLYQILENSVIIGKKREEK